MGHRVSRRQPIEFGQLREIGRSGDGLTNKIRIRGRLKRDKKQNHPGKSPSSPASPDLVHFQPLAAGRLWRKIAAERINSPAFVTPDAPHLRDVRLHDGSVARASTSIAAGSQAHHSLGFQLTKPRPRLRGRRCGNARPDSRCAVPGKPSELLKPAGKKTRVLGLLQFSPEGVHT